MNTIVTSKEAILSVCRELAIEHGLQSLSIWTVAKKCSVSVGSVYNYFPSNSDLIAAVIQDVWQSIFNLSKVNNQTDCFVDYVIWIFDSAQDGILEYPGFFTAHSMSFASLDKEKGRQVMSNYFDHMQSGMLISLQKDRNVKTSVFTEKFTQNDFVDFIFTNIITLLLKPENSCTMLTEIIKRAISTLWHYACSHKMSGRVPMHRSHGLLMIPKTCAYVWTILIGYFDMRKEQKI